MVLTETALTAVISGLIGAILTAFMGYLTFIVKLESRLKDLEHKIELLEPLKNLLLQVGSERAEKVFKGEDK